MNFRLLTLWLFILAFPANLEASQSPTSFGNLSDKFEYINRNTVVFASEKVENNEGEIIHQMFDFSSPIVQHAYFKPNFQALLIRLKDGTVWRSLDEGYTWVQPVPDEKFLAFYHHPTDPDRSYLITSGTTFYATTDGSRSWYRREAPFPPNTFGAQVLQFHPESDRLIWIGNKQCNGGLPNCHAVAFYSRDNGRVWTYIEDYVVNCVWASKIKLIADPTEIVCESYQRKDGDQRFFSFDNPLELIEGQSYYSTQKRLFKQVVGFAKFSEFLIVAELASSGGFLELQVSLDGVDFVTGSFPQNMHPATHAYTVLESPTGSLFIHMTTSEPPSPYWGTLLKSNSTGTDFVVALSNVNRDSQGYVDFDRQDGIAVANIVLNPLEASISGVKIIGSRITHNDGSIWKPLRPPAIDSQGDRYACDTVACSLHVHGYTERRNPETTYSRSPYRIGTLVAVGNVGESLAAYTNSDTFLSRDAGFTWEEIHKDAHLWKFGDSGSILVMANDKEPTDHVLFSTDEGLSWRKYKFTDDKVRVNSIITTPLGTSRRFILMGQYPSKQAESVAIYIDFSKLTSRQCVLEVDNPANSDFESWSPSGDDSERCLFGRQTLYHRRIRESDCFIGAQNNRAQILRNCQCAANDFECEFNYLRDENNKCVLAPGTTPLPNHEACTGGQQYWYERTAYRMISYSSCEGGTRPDRGKPHPCAGVVHTRDSSFFWWFVVLIIFTLVGLVGLASLYFYRRRNTGGKIQLPIDMEPGPAHGGDAGTISAKLAFIPKYLVWVAGIPRKYLYHSRRGYQDIPVGEDVQILRTEDEG